ncbi:glycosyl transferase, group 1 [Caballeronia fortuita]|uniref:Glycosyl transferase, group 1 n=1 Tax=Caballeronia fortuita TaxID=1777138 RepID=A0A158E0H4_9BURK|nr:glycosyltransferase family 1 protein [Caballeronia fortuita]SAL00405.1 glycosyl transferase, group 1 [Caballeronia fortuita]
MEGVIFDGRWKGMHGIGRFATEVSDCLRLTQAELRGNPASPFDWLYLSVKLTSRTKTIFFSPGYSYPLFYRGRGVLVVHDLIHVDVPCSFWFLKKLYCELILRTVCRRASAVLTVSEFSKRRLAEFTGIVPAKIRVVGNGVSDAFKKDGPVFELEDGETYFLGISNGKGHKNNEKTIDGFIAADLGDRVKLLFLGRPSAAILSHVEERKAHDRIRFLGRLSEEELAALYRGAQALIFPSLYEGFGLPIVESMACGTPVITSNCTAMPEIGRDVAIMVDPSSSEQIAQAIRRLSGNDALRRVMGEKGIVRARDFKWEDVARKIEAVLAELNDRAEARS